MPADADIEESVLEYMRLMAQRSDVSTRNGAIRYVTGEMDVLPSAVAKVIGRLLEAETLKHIDNDRLIFKR